MGYRNIKPEMINIVELMQTCGLFKDIETNGGYGCKSKSKDKDESNLCFAWDCPLAWAADLSDMKKYDQYLYDEYKTEKYEPCYIGSDWVVQ